MAKAQFFPLYDTAPRKGFPFLTVSLIILNVLIFFWSLTDFERIIYKYGFIPAKFSFFTIFTCMFLHGGFDHIFGNMWYLWIFGDNVEGKLGKIRFILLYFFSGFFATFLHFITEPTSKIPSIGASGAISGILGAYLYFFPKEKILSRVGYTFIHIPAFIVIGFWFLLQLLFGMVSLFGLSGSNIAFWAHIGGFMFGFLFSRVLKKKRRKF